MHLLETVLVASHHFLRWVRRALVAALLWRVRLLVMIVLLRAIAGRTAVSQRNSIDVVSHERRICTDVRLSVALLFLARSVRSEGHVYVHIAPVPHWRWRISMGHYKIMMNAPPLKFYNDPLKFFWCSAFLFCLVVGLPYRA